MLVVGLILFGLSGCATLDIDERIATVNRDYRDFTGGNLRQSGITSAETAALYTELDRPLSQESAVRITLIQSPEFQLMLNEYSQRYARAMQAGRIANPIFAFERLRAGDELELGQLFSIGLVDLVTLPQRRRIAAQSKVAEEWRLAGEVVEKITGIRKSWVRAVSAQQIVRYAEQVLESAEASAELAQRMEKAGNFNRITRARQQAFHADATTQLVVARQEAVSRREELIRMLGLDDEAARKMTLPEMLPTVPDKALSIEDLGRQATTARLDLQWARYELEATRAAQGLTRITSWVDAEVAGRRDRIADGGSGGRETEDGYEIALRLPIFDAGDFERAAMNAETLAAVNRYESVRRAAGSHLREHYLAYKTAHELAIHHRDEIVPLRRTISEENLLRYNGMLIGVFELLADSREQIAAVMSSIAAQEQFWLADAALRASMVGKPNGVEIMAPRGAADAPRSGGH